MIHIQCVAVCCSECCNDTHTLSFVVVCVYIYDTCMSRDSVYVSLHMYECCEGTCMFVHVW